MKLKSHNKHAEHFDIITDRFIEEFNLADEEILLIGIKHLVEYLVKAKPVWPEDILGFADYVHDRYETIPAKRRRAKDQAAWAYVQDFLADECQEAELQELLQANL